MEPPVKRKPLLDLRSCRQTVLRTSFSMTKWTTSAIASTTSARIRTSRTADGATVLRLRLVPRHVPPEPHATALLVLPLAGQTIRVRAKAGRRAAASRATASHGARTTADGSKSRLSRAEAAKPREKQPVIIHKESKIDRLPSLEQLEQLPSRPRGEKPALLTRNREA